MYIYARARRRKLLDEKELDGLFSGLVERREKQFVSIMKDWLDIFVSWHYVREQYLPLVVAFQKVDEAIDNLNLLKCISELKVKDLGKSLSNSLSKLIALRIFRMRIESLCMECTLKKGYEPYHIIEKYSEEPILAKECRKCGGHTIFHAISIEAPYSFAPLFKENRLPEFIIGYTITTSPKIKKVYIHKNVQTLTEKGYMKGKQVDIFAITENNKTLLIEVTTSKDLNKIMKDVKKKEKSIEDIPYDALVFITPSLSLERYIPYDKVRIFGARHIPKIVSHIEYLIEEISD